MLHPWVSIAPEGKKIRLKLYGDYFNISLLRAGHFRLNNAPGGMTISTVQHINASECLLTISDDVTGSSEISVTVSEKVLNTRHDLTSNRLAASGIENENPTVHITVFQEGEQIHLRCNQPEILPSQVKILSFTGQSLGTFRIDKTQDNIISSQIAPGLYFVLLKTENQPYVLRFVKH